MQPGSAFRPEADPAGRAAVQRAWIGPALLALVYIVFGVAYIEVSGRVVAHVAQGGVEVMESLERAKGFAFMVLNGVALFTAAYLYRRRLERTRGALERERARVARFERQLDALHEGLPSGLLVVEVSASGGFRVERTNPAFARLLGLAPGALERGGTGAIEGALGPARWGELSHDLAACAASGQPIEREYTAPTSRGTASFLQHTVPLFDERGRVEFVFASLNDTTVLRAGQRRLSELEEEVRRSQRLLTIGELASGVAHDVNNLLTVIATHADVLRRSLDGHPELGRSLEVIESAVEKASGISRSLLGFSRKLKSHPQVLPIEPVVREIAELLERTLAKAHPIRLDLDGAAGVAVDGDRIQIQQVLLNLVLNARDAMPSGGPIEVTAGAAPDPACVRISVLDRGVGVPPEIAERVFEPFFTTKDDDRGTGLGLSLSRRIAREHGGELVLEPREGGGTSALFDLPRARAVEDADTPLPGGRWVLLLEEHPQVRAILSSELAELGYRVMLADDGQALAEALATTESPPSLVIVDASSLEASLAALDAARLRGARQPALLMTLEDPTAMDISARAPLHVLRKPFGVADFGRAVRKAVGSVGAGAP